MAKTPDEMDERNDAVEETAIVTQAEEDHNVTPEPARQVKEVDYTSKQNLILALILLTLAAFANSLGGRFVHDDVPQIIENQTLGHWDAGTIKGIFTHDIWATFRPNLARGKLDSLYYRPFFPLFLMAGYEVAGNNPETSPLKWHLLVLLLHLISVILCFFVLEKSLQIASSMDDKKRRMIAAFGAAIFAVHPVQVESIAWISGFVNPLSVITMFAAFYCYLHYREKKRVAILAAGFIAFAISAFTKESALVLVPIIAAYELFVLNRDSTWSTRTKNAVIWALPFACIAFIYMAMRYSALGVLYDKPVNANFFDDQSLTFMDNLRTLPALLVGYMKLVLMPFNLSLIYEFGYTRSLGFGNFLLPLILMLAVVAGLVQACRRIPEALIAVIWITIPLLPHLNTRVFASEELLHDRYLYVSMAGVGLLAALLLSRMVESKLFSLQKDSFVRLAALTVVALCLLTAVQNKHWHDNNTVWDQAAKTASKTRVVQLALGWRAEMEGDAQKALHHYDAALRIQPDMVDALNNSALLLARTGHWEEATPRFERIVQLTPEKAVARFNLAFAYASQRRFAEATREQSQAISLDPEGPRAEEWRAMLAQLEKLSAGQSIRPADKN